MSSVPWYMAALPRGDKARFKMVSRTGVGVSPTTHYVECIKLIDRHGFNNCVLKDSIQYGFSPVAKHNAAMQRNCDDGRALRVMICRGAKDYDAGEFVVTSVVAGSPGFYVLRPTAERLAEHGVLVPDPPRKKRRVAPPPPVVSREYRSKLEGNWAAFSRRLG